MHWLVIIDPIKKLNPETDTSLALIREAQQQAIEIETATIDDLFIENHSAAVKVSHDDRKVTKKLDEYSLILMRKEPPYDLAFHYATHLLSHTSTPVINSPASLRDWNEKIISFNFGNFMPETLVSSNKDQILDFVRYHKSCVIKSLDSFQGRAVVRISPDDTEIIDKYTSQGNLPVMVQEFLNEVYQGDKRVLLLGTTVLGTILRRPLTGYHANFVNSTNIITDLTIEEQKAVERIGPWLVNNGIHFSGIDFIGEKLTEINITCPTGIIQISQMSGENLSQKVIKYLLQLIG